MKATELADLISLLVRKELKAFKKEIISELKAVNNSKPTLTESKAPEYFKKYRQQIQTEVKRSNRPLSKDPLLNSILSDTKPLGSEESEMEEYLSEVNLPTSETGRVIQNVPKSLLKAMNTDYSGMFKNENKTQPKANAGEIRDKLRRMVMEDDFDSVSNGSNDDEDEDFSFLDQIS